MDDPAGTLTQEFSRMATSDRDTLIRQFQQILGEDHVLSPHTCAFFLDMTNWYERFLVFSATFCYSSCKSEIPFYF